MGSKKSKTTTTVKLDKDTQELNKYRLAQEKLMAPYRARAAELVGNVFDPQTGLPTGATSGYRDMFGKQIAGMDLAEVYKNIPGFADLKFTGPEEAVAASRLAALTDISGLQRSASQTLDKVLAPQLLASATAMGMGRSGAPLEAIQKAAMQMALPIEQARMGAETNLASWLTGRGDLRTGLAANVSDPSKMYFQSAPTTTQTTKQSGGVLGSILGTVGTVAGSVFGGPVGGMFGGMLGNLFGGNGFGGMNGMAGLFGTGSGSGLLGGPSMFNPTV